MSGHWTASFDLPMNTRLLERDPSGFLVLRVMSYGYLSVGERTMG